MYDYIYIVCVYVAQKIWLCKYIYNPTIRIYRQIPCLLLLLCHKNPDHPSSYCIPLIWSTGFFQSFWQCFWLPDFNISWKLFYFLKNKKNGFYLRGSHGLRAWGTRRTKSRGPKPRGPKPPARSQDPERPRTFSFIYLVCVVQLFVS